MKILFLLFFIVSCQNKEHQKIIDSLMAEKFATKHTLKEFLDQKYPGLYKVSEVKKDKIAEQIRFERDGNKSDTFWFTKMSENSFWQPGYNADRLFLEMTGHHMLKEHISRKNLDFDANVILRKLEDLGLKGSEEKQNDFIRYVWDNVGVCEFDLKKNEYMVYFHCESVDSTPETLIQFNKIVKEMSLGVYDDYYPEFETSINSLKTGEIEIKQQPWVNWQTLVTEKDGKKTVRINFYPEPK